MISKNQQKLITSLSIKKHRDDEGLFVAEGSKLVLELATNFKLHSCYATSDWLSANKKFIPITVEEIDEVTLRKLSNQITPQGILAVFHKPESFEIKTKGLILALDNVQDPGNLGTIVRIADWFGIKQIVCSEHCADIYNPKTVQATMGAIARVQVIYTNLMAFLEKLPASTSIYGTFMEGESLYQTQFTTDAIVVMGNEGNGISPAIEQFITQKITIPPYPADEQTSESLNVAVATAVVCAEFRRRLSK